MRIITAIAGALIVFTGLGAILVFLAFRFNSGLVLCPFNSGWSIDLE